MTLLSALLSAVQHLPNAAYLRQQIGKHKMTLTQSVIAAIYQITDTEDYGFYVAEEPVLIERIIEATELPFNDNSYWEVKSRLSGVMAALKEIGVDVTRNGRYLTVFGPGVKGGQ